MNDWDGYGLRPSRGLSGYTPNEVSSPILKGFLDSREAELTEPLRGITTDGVLRPDLFRLSESGRTDTAPITDAACGLLELLDAGQRDRLCFPLDSDEKRRWLNVHPNLLRHGLLLADLSTEGRRAATTVMEATLSARGFRQARDVMRPATAEALRRQIGQRRNVAIERALQRR